jgi:protein-tyrosine phosphatase
MIDIHAHILPGVDDGPQTVRNSLQMMRQAQEAGLEAICATPHILNHVTPELDAAISQAFEVVRREAQEADLKVQMSLGSEIYLRPDVMALRRHHFFSLDRSGKYVLMELPLGRFPLGTDRLIYDLRLEGITPVIAHPERSLVKTDQLQQVEGLVRQGALMQINAGSILGRFGRHPRRMAERLLERGLAHVVASDAHDVQGRSFCLLADAYRRTVGILGRDQAERLFVRNPGSILAGENLMEARRADAHPSGRTDRKCAEEVGWQEHAIHDVIATEKLMPGGAA